MRYDPGNAVKSVTIEMNRFGDPEGVLRLSEAYLRAIGSNPVQEANIGLKQKDFRLRMKKLSYDRFRSGSPDDVRDEAETALGELIEPISAFLSVPSLGAGSLLQIDVVTNALELAQLPFEVIEEQHDGIVLTRRVRQPWPRPPVVSAAAPRVLFVWAEPKKRATSDKRLTVPHQRHEELLEEVLADWLEAGERDKTLVEIENATFAEIAGKLGDPEHGFTHVHLLAHGRYDEETEKVYLLLEDEEGLGSDHSPRELAELFQARDLPRPGTVVFATCHSGEVDPLQAGGTLGQVLHEAGVPVVVASQLALTQNGSDELIRTFLRRIIGGDDPREALRTCRDALRRRREETYYDRVAVVGYIHLEEDFEKKLPARKLAVALKRLEAASKAAAKAATPLDTRRRFRAVREELLALRQSAAIEKDLLEELLGLLASSLKREAECAWAAAQLAEGQERATLLEDSRNALRQAQAAYREAAQVSLDHHWTGVQSLVLDAVVDGTLAQRRYDWIAACQASRAAARRADDAEQSFWGLGSIVELHLIAPLAGESDALTEAQVDTLLELSSQIGDWPLEVLLRQLDRYLNWWGKDEVWKLPPAVLERARAVRQALTV